MRLLAVHPSGLMYTRVFLTLEPLGLELVAGARRARPDITCASLISRWSGLVDCGG
jgi:hypothetical protein